MQAINIIKNLCPRFYKDFQVIIPEGTVNKLGVYIVLGPYRRHVTDFDVDINGKVFSSHVATQRVKDTCYQWVKLWDSIPYPGLVRWAIENTTNELSQDPSKLRGDLNYVVQQALKKYESRLLRDLPSRDPIKLRSVFKDITEPPYYFTYDERDRLLEMIYAWVDMHMIQNVTVEDIYKAARMYAEILRTMFVRLGGEVPQFLSSCLAALPAFTISNEDWKVLLPKYVMRMGLGTADILVIQALMWRGSKIISIYVP
jgi:hypothetical protein